MTIPKVLRSSENPQRVSLTLQGAIVLILISVLPITGIDLGVNDITLFIESLFIIAASVATAMGIIRKAVNGKWNA